MSQILKDIDKDIAELNLDAWRNQPDPYLEAAGRILKERERVLRVMIQKARDDGWTDLNGLTTECDVPADIAQPDADGLSLAKSERIMLLSGNREIGAIIETFAGREWRWRFEWYGDAGQVLEGVRGRSLDDAIGRMDE